MHRQNEDSGESGILIAVILGSILVVILIAVGFLFLGTSTVSSTPAPPLGSAASTPLPAAEDVQEPAPAATRQK